jgi:putative heme-binding domain-containing protein
MFGRAWAPGRVWCLAIACLSMSLFAGSIRAQDSAMVRLLKGDRVPPERQGTVLEMIGRRGNAADLGYVFSRSLEPMGFAPVVRRQALDALAEAARNRQLRPVGDLSGLERVVGDAEADPALRASAARLAGLWKLEGLADPLAGLAADAGTPASLREAAVAALADLGVAGRARLDALAAPERPRPLRMRAVAAQVRLDPADAAEAAAGLLAEAVEGEDLTGLLGAFLNRRGGPEALAETLGRTPITPDAAKRTLRALYALGRADAPLVATLSQAAGLDAEIQPPTDAEVAALVAEVQSKGDPARGEQVFRRPDLNCIGCHAVAGAGGGVGPDLSPLGSSSPPDYILRSILVPDEAIKEQYQTLVVQTTDGQVFQGIVADRDPQRLVLKGADGSLQTIPTADIEDQREGGSLMPKGLPNLLTHEEFVDLVRFLSELGKPGPYAIRATPTIQRWRVRRDVPERLATDAPDPALLAPAALEAEADQWAPAYALVSGALSLADLTPVAGGPVLYLAGEVEVSVPGPVLFRLDAPEGTTAWLDGQPARLDDAALTAELSRGRHTLVLRVDTQARPRPTLSVEVTRPPGSTAQVTVVGGR